MSLCVDSRSVHVVIEYPSEDDTVAARSDGSDGILVKGLPFPKSMEKLSNGPALGRSHFNVAPGNSACGSNEGDDV